MFLSMFLSMFPGACFRQVESLERHCRFRAGV